MSNKDMAEEDMSNKDMAEVMSNLNTVEDMGDMFNLNTVDMFNKDTVGDTVDTFNLSTVAVMEVAMEEESAIK